jgi:hypothetical protein
VTTIDVFTKLFRGEFSFGCFVSRESFWVVWDVKTTINGSFHGSEDTRSSGSSGQTNIEEDFKWSASFTFRLLDFVESTISLDNSLVDFVKSNFFGGEETTSKEETSGVGSWVVFETSFGSFRVDRSSISRKFVGVGSSQDDIMVDGGISDLASNFSVGESNDESVFRTVVFVFVLKD